MAEFDRELKNALQQIEKQFGKGSIMQLGDRPSSLARPAAPQDGVPQLDEFLGQRQPQAASHAGDDDGARLIVARQAGPAFGGAKGRPRSDRRPRSAAT